MMTFIKSKQEVVIFVMELWTKKIPNAKYEILCFALVGSLGAKSLLFFCPQASRDTGVRMG